MSYRRAIPVKPDELTPQQLRLRDMYRRKKSEGFFETVEYGYRAKRGNAKDEGYEFSISIDEYARKSLSCPQCGQDFNSSSETRCSQPQLDRIDPSLGYVPGNVEWTHMRCNRRKQDLSYIGMIMFGLVGLLRTGNK